MRTPGIAKRNTACDTPVSLIDLYPTLVDLCGLTGDTKKNGKGHALDGHSLKQLLKNPESGEWSGPDETLTPLYKWRMKYDLSRESYSLRSKDWRYIRYENGKEELYDTVSDPHEWHNLAGQAEYRDRLSVFRYRLQARLPSPGTVPPQPEWQSKDSNNPKANAEGWKDKYFAKHSKADADMDGNLAWPEYKAYRTEFDPEPPR